MGWINDVLKATSDAESPTQYIYWGALAAISAVLRKNVWINRQGIYRLYPNIYVFFIGKSGLRKGFPVTVAKNLVESIGVTRVLGGRASIQGLMKNISQAHTLENGTVLRDAHIFLASGEFASFIIEDPVAIYCMTDLHDTHAHEKEFTYTLSGEGSSHVLKNPCITLLGASNEINLTASLPKVAHGGGFVARTFMVYADKKSKINSLLDEGQSIDYAVLSSRLREISKLNGPFRITTEAKQFFGKWYLGLQRKIEDVEDPTGTMERIHDQVLKVAMLLSVADRNDLILEKFHMEEAIEKAQSCVPGMRKVMMGSGVTSVEGTQTKIVIRELLREENFEMTRRKLLRKCWPDFDAFALDKVVETLIQAGIVRHYKKGQDQIYKLDKDAAAAFLEFGQSQ